MNITVHTTYEKGLLTQVHQYSMSSNFEFKVFMVVSGRARTLGRIDSVLDPLDGVVRAARIDTIRTALEKVGTRSNNLWQISGPKLHTIEAHLDASELPVFSLNRKTET